MSLFKPGKAFAAGCMLLIPSLAPSPALAEEPPALDEATLRQSSAPTNGQDREADRPAPRAHGDKDEARREDPSQIVRSTDTDLRTATPEVPLSLNVQPVAQGFQDPATNFVFSASLNIAPAPVAP